MNLDTEQLNALSPSDRDRYMELERLFRSKGWKIVMATAQENVNIAILVGANASTWADNRVAFGNRTAWQTILGLEEQTEDLYETKANSALKVSLIDHILDEHENE